MKEYWSRRIRDAVPYVPGEQPRGRTFIKLNTNENPYPPSPKVVEAVKSAAGEGLRLYPDPECAGLRAATAKLHGVTPEQVFPGNICFFQNVSQHSFITVHLSCIEAAVSGRKGMMNSIFHFPFIRHFVNTQPQYRHLYSII